MSEIKNTFESQFSKASQDELKDAFKGINWKNQEQRSALAETIVRVIYQDIQMEDLTAQMADVEYFELKDTMQFAGLKGIKAYVHEPGSYATKSVLVKKTLTLYEKMVSINPTINILELDSGRYGSLVDLKREARDVLLGERYSAIWNTLTGSIVTGDANYAGFAAIGDKDTVKKPVIDTALAYLYDVGAKPKAIIGRYSALSFLTNITGYSPAFQEMRDKSGFLGSYQGVPILYLQQYLDGYGTVRISASDIMIVSEGTVKVGIKFDIDRYVMEHIDVNTYDWNMHAAEMFGVGVVYGERDYRIHIV